MKIYICGQSDYDGSNNVFVTSSKKKAYNWKTVADRLLRIDGILRKLGRKREEQIRVMFPQKIDKYWEDGKMTSAWEKLYNDIKDVEKNDPALITISEARDILEDIAEPYRVLLFYKDAYVQEWKVEPN